MLEIAIVAILGGFAIKTFENSKRKSAKDRADNLLGCTNTAEDLKNRGFSEKETLAMLEQIWPDVATDVRAEAWVTAYNISR